jgi:RNA-binding protein YlmH
MTSEEKFLLAGIADKARQCDENSMITNSVFLDMHERSVVTGMKNPFSNTRMFFYGGFAEAERNIALFFPEYITDEPIDYFDMCPNDDPIAIIEIEKDKFSPALGHRDYLGALMGLGIKREMTGDIAVNESGCKIAVLAKIAPFIAENLGKAGRGTLKAKIIPPSEAREGAKSVGISDSFTVSSLRLDSVVKNAFRLSRGDAADAIESGVVYVNDVECTKPDKKIAEGDKIVFRRKGRIIVNDCSSVSKKGRVIVEITRFQ